MLLGCGREGGAAATNQTGLAPCHLDAYQPQDALSLRGLPEDLMPKTPSLTRGS